MTSYSYVKQLGHPAQPVCFSSTFEHVDIKHEYE